MTLPANPAINDNARQDDVRFHCSTAAGRWDRHNQVHGTVSDAPANNQYWHVFSEANREALHMVKMVIGFKATAQTSIRIALGDNKTWQSSQSNRVLEYTACTSYGNNSGDQFVGIGNSGMGGGGMPLNPPKADGSYALASGTDQMAEVWFLKAQDNLVFMTWKMPLVTKSGTLIYVSARALLPWSIEKIKNIQISVDSGTFETGRTTVEWW